MLPAGKEEECQTLTGSNDVLDPLPFTAPYHTVQHNLAAWELGSSVADAGMPEATRKAITQFYTDNSPRIRMLLAEAVGGSHGGVTATSDVGDAAADGAVPVVASATAASSLWGIPQYRGLE